MGTLKIEGRPGGPLMTVSYRLVDEATGAWALVDPTYGAADLWRDRIEQSVPHLVLITHAHFDHVGGLAELRRNHPAIPVYVHPDSAILLGESGRLLAQSVGLDFEPAEATRHYREGDTVEIGRTKLRVIDAPGHCPGSVVLYAPGVLIAGDVLFEGGVGRWDLPGASYETLAATIRDKIMTLPDDTVVYPGHGPATTIGRERHDNYIVAKMLAGESVD